MADSDQTVETLLRRIEHLEADRHSLEKKLNRMAIVLLIGLLVVVAATSYLYSKRIGIPSKVVAKSLLITDDMGKERLWAGVNEDGPGIGIFGEDGQTRLWMGLNSGKPSVGLYGPDNKIRGTFGYGGEQGFLYLFDNAGSKVFGGP